jgi:predicted outer membrane repeat protein
MSAILLRSTAAVVLLVAPIAFAPCARANDWYVDQNYASCSTGNGSASAPFCNIANAIAAAAAGDTIHVAPGTYHLALDVDRSLTFIATQGASVTAISGQSSHLAVTIETGVTVDVQGFSIVDGSDPTCGGVYVHDAATVTFEDCVFQRNMAFSGTSAHGGAMQVRVATVTVTRCTFADNVSAWYGGAIEIAGGAVYAYDCDFHGNDAKGYTLVDYSGGAIYMESGSTLDVERTTFTDNHAIPYDPNQLYISGGAICGAIYVTGITAVDCTFSSNSAENGYGGAIYGSSIDLTRCEFDGNQSPMGGAINAGNLTARDCRFAANIATVRPQGAAGYGGALLVSGTSSCEECVFESNEVVGGLGGGAMGGAVYATGTTLTRCRIAGNTADGGYYGGPSYGGGLAVGDDVTLSDCEVVANEAGGGPTGTAAGIGGGIESVATRNLSLVRCTIGGNRCTNSTGVIKTGGYGGGIDVSGSVCDLDHTIVAGNSAAKARGAQDLSGTVNSLGWNDFGNTGGATINGPGTADLLNVDPVYADPANGDFRLDPTSPCIDSGDPTLQLTGADVAFYPRWLDGDLDRVQIVDRGAHEFSNVTLALSGTLTPGGTATLDASGTAGLAVLVVVGTTQGELDLRPLGALFVDLTAPFLIFPFGVIPNTQTFTIDPNLPVPLTVELQAAAFAAGAGNLGNLVEATIR